MDCIKQFIFFRGFSVFGMHDHTAGLVEYKYEHMKGSAMSADVFISYKSDEESYAKTVRKVLEDNGISCWMAPDSIPAGSNYMKQIPQAIDDCKVMIILISKKSQQSTWVKNEFSQAVTKHKTIIPYVIQDCPLEDEFQFSMSTMQQVYAWRDEEAALQRIVRDIRASLNEDEQEKVEIKVVHKTRTPAWVYALIGVLAVAVIGAVIFVNLTKKAVSNHETAAHAASVYYSEIVPYSLAGFYETAQMAENDRFSMNTYDRAFSLLSFIRNDTGKSMFVEKIAVDILDLVPVTVPEIVLDGVMNEENVFTILAFNDGWGDADNIPVKWSVIPENGVPAFPSFIESMSGQGTVTVKSGEAALILKKQADFHELLEWARSQDSKYLTSLYTLMVEADCGDTPKILAMFLLYDPDTDRITYTFGGADSDRPTITLYGVLDVDNPPKSIRFTTGDSTPLVDDTFRIETVIIPTKSCDVTLRGSYSMGGDLYETNAYSVRVSVPYFEENSNMLSGKMTRELAEIDMNDVKRMRQICSKYRYDIQSILPEDVPRG